MYSDNDPRENFLNNTFIKYIGFVDNFIIGLVIFDRNEPQRGARRDNRDIWIDEYRLENCEAKIKFDLEEAYMENLDSLNYDKLKRAREIARQYRPGVGRETKALYASLALSFGLSNAIKNLMFPNYIVRDRDYDNIIESVIRKCFYNRHPINNTDNNKPRFITMPYQVSMRTAPISWTNTGHFVTLIVDLDHRDNNDNFKPFVYVYDSAHMLCKWYGFINNALNKDSYFKFGDNILVDDEVLNNDLNLCPCFYINDNKTSTVQYLSKLNRPLDCRCGYYCEAAINLLLKNEKFIDNNGNNIEAGKNTRNFLKDILKNGSIMNEIRNEIIPPLAYFG